MADRGDDGTATRKEDTFSGMNIDDSTEPIAGRGDSNSSLPSTVRLGTIESSSSSTFRPSTSFPHLFAPVSSTATSSHGAEEEVTNTLQSLSVTTSSSETVYQSSMSSIVDHGGQRRDVVTPTPPVAGSAGSMMMSATSASTGSTTMSGTGTPELSPALIASLRGTSSPSHSQVSVGSIGPALTSAVLSQHKYDLTPVMRNTSDLYCDYMNHKAAGGTNDNVMTITPSSQEGYLHGEHLAFPSDFSSSSSGGGPNGGPTIPPLQPVARNSSTGSLSAGSGDHHHHHHDYHQQPRDQPFLQSRMISSTGLRSDIHLDTQVPLLVPDPVQFPSRKYYSFTTRKQYEEACMQDGVLLDSDDDLYNRSDSDDDDDPNNNAIRGMRYRRTPYAPPSRPADFGVEQVPEEELRRIFITRDHNNNARTSNASTDNTAADHPNRHLAELPLDQRVPSLRMANHLHGSTTSISYTDQEDEDSVLHLRDADDASLSSRGSSLYLPNEEELLRPTHEDPMATVVDDEVFLLLQRKQRKRKQRKKEQRAVEWLQSVEADQNVLAEAASSKFLTQSGGNSPASGAFRRQSSPAVSLSRQISSPSTLLTTPRTNPIG